MNYYDSNKFTLFDFTINSKNIFQIKEIALNEIRKIYPKQVNPSNMYLYWNIKRKSFCACIYHGMQKFSIIDKVFILIYISLNTIHKESNQNIYIPKSKMTSGFRRRVLGISICTVFILCLVAAVINKNSLIEMQKQKEKNNQLIHKQKINIEKEQKLNEELNNIIKTYHEVFLEKTIVPYEILSLIFECMTPSSIIQNISITGNKFEITCNSTDCVKVLQLFEKNENILTASLLRNTNEKNTNIFIIQGEVACFPKDINEGNTKEKIDFYKKEIDTINNYLKERQKQSISEMIFSFRQIVYQNRIKENYIQKQSNNDLIDLEISFEGATEQIIEAIKQMSESFYVNNISLTNYRDKNKISVTITVKTFISNNIRNFVNTNNNNYPVIPTTKIVTLFSDKKQKKYMYKVTASETEKKPIKKNFTVIGKTKTLDSKVCLLIKNNENSKYMNITNFIDKGSCYLFDYENEIIEVNK